MTDRQLLGAALLHALWSLAMVALGAWSARRIG